MSAFDGPVGTDTLESGPGSNAGSGVIGGGGVAALGAAAGLRTVAFGTDGVAVVAEDVALAAAAVEDATDDDGAGDAESEVVAEATGAPRSPTKRPDIVRLMTVRARRPPEFPFTCNPP